MDGQSVSYSFGYAHQEERTFRTFRSYNTMAAFVWSLWKASIFSISSSWHGSFSKVSFMIVTFLGNGFIVGGEKKLKVEKKILKVSDFYDFLMCVLFLKNVVMRWATSRDSSKIWKRKSLVSRLRLKWYQRLHIGRSTSAHIERNEGIKYSSYFWAKNESTVRGMNIRTLATFFILFWLNTYCSLWLYFSFLLKFIYSRFLPIFAS